MSMKPGHNTLPRASIVSSAASGCALTFSIRPFAIATLATNAGAPVPSTTVAPVKTRSVTSVCREELGDRAFDDGALEEVRVGTGVKAHRVREREFLEVRGAEPAAVDHLPRLLEHLAHVGYVPVRDVGPHHRVEPSSEGVDRVVERS